MVAAFDMGGTPRAPEQNQDAILSARELEIAAKLAEAAMPPGAFLEGGGPATAIALAAWLHTIPRDIAKALTAVLWTLEMSTLPTKRTRFSRLDLDERMATLRAIEDSRSHAIRSALRGILTPLKLVHVSRPEMFSHVGCRFDLPMVRDEEPRWMAQVTNGREVEEDLELDCEVIVIGSGAGGAAVAYELASQGRAVLLLEEGDYHKRSSFRGRPTASYRAMYRDAGLTMALGNVGIPLWAGRAVGGSTVINSGTCYRAPERTFRAWREEGLPADMSREGLDAYYRRVETMLQVEPANPLYVGAIGPIIARGAELLGFKHGVLPRNAPGCDGQGVCCFGCPTGAKRSTDVSYVPEALKRGAQLITAARVDTIQIVAGRARGVTARLGEGPNRPRLKVRAEVVIAAGGTLMTPLLLGKHEAFDKTKALGKNLSIHPATKVLALMNERVDQWNGIPQGYTIDHFSEEGLMFEGGSLPFDIAALGVPWTGRRFTELMEQYPNLATFGFMIQDTSRGSVRRGRNGSPMVLYDLNERDLAQMQRAIAILSEVYLAAGSKRVLPLVVGHDEIASRADVDRLRSAKLKPGDFEITAFHPLGTCRMGVDPARSCVDASLETHAVKNLYVTDGSVIPSSLGVNPQMTIMALALRTAEIIHERLA
jgi:hypothetical protein